MLKQILGFARGFAPMTEGEMRALRGRVAEAAADGHLELYKTSKHFDGPPGRKQHKFPRSKNSPRSFLAPRVRAPASQVGGLIRALRRRPPR